MITIPNQLKDKRLRFLKIKSGTKIPFEDNWNKYNNYKYGEKEFQEYIKKNNNYGVLCTNGLVIIDIDNNDDKSLLNKILLELPKTFTVKTGNNGFHFYFWILDLKDKIVLTKNGKHYGEVQADGAQCVGPGSLHPNGNSYEIYNNSEIKAINLSDLKTIIKEYNKERNTSNFETINTGLNWDISKLIEPVNNLLKQQGRPLLETKDNVKWRGGHPVESHGSTTGHNFEIDTGKNTWYCFRCERGGDSLSLIAMIEGYLDKGQCLGKSYFKHFKKKKLFLKMKDIGIKKFGYRNKKRKYSKNTTRDKKPKLYIELKNKKGEKVVKLNTNGISNYITKKFQLIIIEEPNGGKSYTYYYDRKDNFYRRDRERTIIKDEIHTLFGKYWVPSIENELLKYLEVLKIVRRDNIISPRHLINTNNGIYNLENGKLQKHNPKYYFMHKIRVNYNENATCPKIMEFFHSALPSEYIDFMQELFGYCLYSSYEIPGFFQFLGSGGNGKSVCTYLLMRLLGSTACSNKEIHDISADKFGSSQLYGKLCNVAEEISYMTLKATGLLKALAAGNRINAQFKGQDSFEFDNIAKIIVCCNEMPDIADTSEAWYDRQYIVPFINKFRDTKKEKTQLKYKLTNNKKEMEGLLLWSIKGLQRLLENGKFSYPHTSKKERFLQLKNPVENFFEKNYEKTDDLADKIPKTDVYNNYKKYCKKQRIPLKSQKELTIKFKEMHITESREPKIRFWTGIKRI